MEIRSFKWDEGTIDHIADHGVTPDEVEEIAFEGSPYIRKGKQGKPIPLRQDNRRTLPFYRLCPER